MRPLSGSRGLLMTSFLSRSRISSPDPVSISRTSACSVVLVLHNRTASNSVGVGVTMCPCSSWSWVFLASLCCSTAQARLHAQPTLGLVHAGEQGVGVAGVHHHPAAHVEQWVGPEQPRIAAPDDQPIRPAAVDAVCDSAERVLVIPWLGAVVASTHDAVTGPTVGMDARRAL